MLFVNSITILGTVDVFRMGGNRKQRHFTASFSSEDIKWVLDVNLRRPYTYIKFLIF